LGSTLTFSRLQEDRELLAMETVGINIHFRLTGCVMALSLLFLAAQIPLVKKEMPNSRAALKYFAYQSRNIIQNFRLKPGVWLEAGSARLMAKEAEGGKLSGVTLYAGAGEDENGNKKKNNFHKVTGGKAEYAIAAQNENEARLRILMKSGTLRLPDWDKPGDITACEFATYENYIPLTYAASFQKNWREHTDRQLRLRLADSERYGVQESQKQEISFELASRLSLILAVLALAFSSSFACERFSRLTRGFGFGLGLALLTAYWIVMVLSASLRMPWLTNPLYLALTVGGLSFIRR